jgi:hypothetical protein
MGTIYNMGFLSSIASIHFPKGKTGPAPPPPPYDITYTLSYEGGDIPGNNGMVGLFCINDLTINNIAPIGATTTLSLSNVKGSVILYVWDTSPNWTGTAQAFYPGMGQFVDTWGSFVANGYNSAGKPAVVQSPISPILNNTDFSPTSPALVTPAFVANANNFVNGNVWSLYSYGEPPIIPVGWFYESVIGISINFDTRVGVTTFTGTGGIESLPGG